MSIPKIIWVFWSQGFENAPPLAHICLKTWETQNPGWDIRVVSESNIRTYLDPAFCDEVFRAGLPHVKVSDVFRFALIARYGGVYVDADCFCTKPLNDWIDTAAASGFFAFRFLESDLWLADPSVSKWQRYTAKTKDRILASWLIAGKAGNSITTRIWRSHFDLLAQSQNSKGWLGRTFSRKIYRSLKRNAFTAAQMGNPALIARVGSYPYYLVHYHFAHLVLTDPAFRAAWHQVEKRSADDALAFSQTLGLPIDDVFKDAMAGTASPVYKFHFRTTAPLQDGAVTRYDWLLAEYGGGTGAAARAGGQG